MIRTLSALAVAAVLMAGCGGDPSDGSKHPAGGKPTDNVAEVGKDVKAGVYTADANSCLGFTATTREFSLEDEEPKGEMLEGSVLVRDQDRIVLNAGDFFHTVACPPEAWKREKDDGPKSVDPATVKGACALLIHDKLLEQTLTYPKQNEDKADETRRQKLQERLFSIVTASMFSDIDAGDEMPLAASVGQLVDFLDDPKAYVENGKLVPDVATQVTNIKDTCKN